ncbi:hypothetical protein RFI_28729 [Reticulomyxa filosa]|uniref:Uncharacterized protein n=1 Tax=Reticulomyxa filosa TaxID=46433 RepID=X6M4T4_RETFI|nr:hypothetical protein RFI_28729 [Reticulomyxa filosa]|eukprot:ETO08656.1 hypothetical protein RFI_28729 [Reticulomyxa filosa]
MPYRSIIEFCMQVFCDIMRYFLEEKLNCRRVQWHGLNTEGKKAYFLSYSIVSAATFFYLMLFMFDLMIQSGLIIDLPLSLRHYSFPIAWVMSYFFIVIWQIILNRCFMFRIQKEDPSLRGDAFRELLWRTYFVNGLSLLFSGIIDTCLRVKVGVSGYISAVIALLLSCVFGYFLLKFCYQRMEQTRAQALKECMEYFDDSSGP